MTDQDQKATTGVAPLLPTAKAPSQPRPLSRSAQLVKLLATKRGADLAAISAKFGWQPHSTRAALTGLRKAGHTVVREVSGNGQPTRYRIVTGGAATRAKVAPNAE